LFKDDVGTELAGFCCLGLGLDGPGEQRDVLAAEPEGYGAAGQVITIKGKELLEIAGIKLANKQSQILPRSATNQNYPQIK
jgi:hypothetical protein